jgi:hypothetical protein
MFTEACKDESSAEMTVYHDLALMDSKHPVRQHQFCTTLVGISSQEFLDSCCLSGAFQYVQEMMGLEKKKKS